MISVGRPHHPSGPRRHRVVFLPGAMGTVLVDGSLTTVQARDECRRNLGYPVDRALRGTALYPCDKRPEILWGDVGSLHWIFAPQAWLRRMTTGNGYDIAGAVRPDGLMDVDIRIAGRRFTFQPYASFLKALRDAGIDVLVFDYDWRLSNRHNARLLQQRILQRWFGGRAPDAGQRLADHEWITLISHSMGGLVARCLVESGSGAGLVPVRRVITIGTPHLGAPQSYLHLIGRTLPLPENPFYRWARLMVGQRMAAAGVAPPASFGTQFLPAKAQTEALAHTAAAFEVLPAYDFVTARGTSERRDQTYRPLVHSGTGRPAARVIGDLQGALVPIPRLADWLQRHGVNYHFLAATGFPTAVGYQRDRDRIVTGPEGDGTVPLVSARAVPGSTGNLHVRAFGAAGGLGHQLLCQRRDVQDYCLGVLTGRTAPAQVSGMGVASGKPAGPVQPDDLVAMARIILRAAPRHRGIVLSVVRLVGDSGAPLIDPTVEPSQRPGGVRLKNPPRHLASPEVYEVRSPRHGAFRYVWVLSNEQATFPVGGILFLPRTGDSVLHLVTFNVGQLDTARCSNGHHAETQMTRWVEEQPPAWRAQIRIVLIQNRSRTLGPRGYSPCNGCCYDLARFLTALKAIRAGRPVQAGISWLELYDRGEKCGHPTDTANLNRLAASGWVLGGPRPAQRELSPAAMSWTMERAPSGSVAGYREAGSRR